MDVLPLQSILPLKIINAHYTQQGHQDTCNVRLWPGIKYRDVLTFCLFNSYDINVCKSCG